MVESENETFNRLAKECENAYAIAKIVQDKYYDFVKDVYKYKLDVFSNGSNQKNCNAFADKLWKSKTFGEYCFNDVNNYVKDFWIPDIDFSDFKGSHFQFRESKNDKQGIVFYILENGDFRIETTYNSSCNIFKEEFEKLTFHDKRDELFQLIINGDSELALILLNNKQQ